MAWPTIAAGMGGVALAFIALGLGIARMRSAAIAVSVVAFVLACAAFGGGLVGRSLGRSIVDDVVVNVDPDHRDEIREKGYAESDQCIRVGGASGVVPALVGVAALAVTLSRKR